MKPNVQLCRVEISPVSEMFWQEVEQALDDLPDCIASLLAQAKYEVVLCRLLVELFPKMRGVPLPAKDGGWDPQKRNRDLVDRFRGLCDPDEKVIFYPEFYINVDAVQCLNAQEVSCKYILYHEIGHAIDTMPELEKFRRLSDTLAFVDAYCRDLGQMSKTKKKKLEYLLNHSYLTRGEIFADTFSAVLEEKSRTSRTQLSRFPHVAAYIREQILAYLAEIYDDPESLQLLYATLSNMPWRRPRISFQELVAKAKSYS